MNLDTTKEEILQAKWTLNKIVKNKTEAVAAKNWEAAAGYRDEEKIIGDCLLTVKSEIQDKLKNLKQSSSESSDDFVLLEELLILIDTNVDLHISL